jgi:hypothetical protein
VFLELRLALELRSLGFLDKIFPVMIGDADDPFITPSPSYTNYFSSGCNPKAADVHVESVEMKLTEHMDAQALGEPLEKNKTVKATLDEILANQGGFIEGDGVKAFDAVAERIVTMMLDCRNEEKSNADSDLVVVGTEATEGLVVRVKALEQENSQFKQEISSYKVQNSFLFDEASAIEEENIGLKDKNVALKRELEFLRQRATESSKAYDHNLCGLICNLN